MLHMAGSNHFLQKPWGFDPELKLLARTLQIIAHKLRVQQCNSMFILLNIMYISPAHR